VTDATDFEVYVRLFLEEHPEHIAGTARGPCPATGASGLVLDGFAALAFMEWVGRSGLARDPERLAARIEQLRAELLLRERAGGGVSITDDDGEPD